MPPASLLAESEAAQRALMGKLLSSLEALQASQAQQQVVGGGPDGAALQLEQLQHLELSRYR